MARDLTITRFLIPHVPLIQTCGPTGTYYTLTWMMAFRISEAHGKKNCLSLNLFAYTFDEASSSVCMNSSSASQGTGENSGSIQASV
jgi:hypothetical protein